MRHAVEEAARADDVDAARRHAQKEAAKVAAFMINDDKPVE